MAGGILAVGSGFATPVLVLIGGTIFGAAYVMLTGVYLVWGVRALPDRPATGLTVGFLTIAIGQTAGAPIFGFLSSALGANMSVMIFAAIALLAGVFQPRATTSHKRFRPLGEAVENHLF